jgi:starch phosphorylase
VKALRRFTVRAALPEPLAALDELVGNLRWSWHPESREVFAAVDPDLWEDVGRDPLRLLGEVGQERLEALAADRRFLRRLQDARDDLQDYLHGPRWYQQVPGAPRSIAYFSPEFGITEVLPQYSGGLGILAGDHLKAASDLGVPVIGVGLLYRRGYFKQSLSADGWQLERYPPIDPQGLPLRMLEGPAMGEQAGGPRVHVDVGLPRGRSLRAQIWVADVGRVPLLLLDSDVEDNPPDVREVTDRLYGGGTDHRLRQEMLLGIGGVRAVRAYCSLTGYPAPEVFHTNEGHAGFLGLERIRELTESAGLDFAGALEAVRAGTVFTTHTPVPAGIDRFPRGLIEEAFGGDNASPGVPVGDILALGAEDEQGDPTVFNMAVMGLRLAQRANGVSRLHGAVSRDMFAGLYPGFDPAEVPIGSVTNGVHAPSWMAREIQDLAAREVGPDPSGEGATWEGFAKVSDQAIWATRRQLRARLVDEVRRRVRASWLQRGASEAELGWVDGVFDPDVATIGFARRVPSYKRLTLMLRDPDRLRALLLDDATPVQLVIAGKAHPADEGGKALVQQVVRFADDPAVRHRIAFLPDYDIGMARVLLAGCDVWLNNPLRPLEACGTSGMKSALNGGLNLSIRDGWWDEMYDGENGWAIPSATVEDPERRDDIEAAALYDLIEAQVRRRFYDVDRDRLPRHWIGMVRHTLGSLGLQVLASRMVREYVERFYAPAAAASAALSADHYAGAKGLADWKRRVREAWPMVRVSHVQADGTASAPVMGRELAVRAVVELGGLAPQDVRVEVAYGSVDDNDELRGPARTPLELVNGGGPLQHYAGTVPLDRTGTFGYTVRVLPDHPLLADLADLGLSSLPEPGTVYTEL